MSSPPLRSLGLRLALTIAELSFHCAPRLHHLETSMPQDTGRQHIPQQQPDLATSRIVHDLLDNPCRRGAYIRAYTALSPILDGQLFDTNALPSQSSGERLRH